MAFIRSRGLRMLFAAVAALTLFVGGSYLAFYLAFLHNLPDMRELADYDPPIPSRVFDRQGQLIGEFFTERRRLTSRAEMPDHVVYAFVAGEDSAFFEHTGIDYMGILRAAWVNLRAGGEIVQGGSTITQQMVKGLLLTPERRIRRKIREMILARRIEQYFTKDEILYLYLNQIYFGHGAYGIGEAAHVYFDKKVSELGVSEGALLAGLPKAPSRYSPFANPDQAERRRRYVLGRMRVEELLDERAYEEALAAPPALATRKESADRVAASAYFTEEVRRYLFEALGGDEVLNGGLRIETTIDASLQVAAVDAVRKGIRDLDRRQGYRGHVRRVAPEALDQEVEDLGRKNDLIEEEPDGPPRVALLEEEPPALEFPDGRTLLGVVTEVEVDEDFARVAFAPGLEGVVRLDTVAWARAANPSEPPRPLKSIDRVLRVGDVARWTLAPPREEKDEKSPDDGQEEATPELEVTLDQEPIAQGALLSVDVKTGEVVALVGGYDFRSSQFNRVTQAKRQPGSAFKPLIYGAAIGRGYTAASVLYDRPVVYTDEASGFVWRPRNYGRSFYGPITMREALVRSVNNATVHLFRDVGVDYVLEYAHDLGIESPLNRDLSLALGSSDVSLLEITRAYAVYPAGGRRVTPIYIRRVTNPAGEVLLENVVLGSAPPDPESNGDGPEEDEIEVELVEEVELEGDASELLLDENGEPVEEVDPNQILTAEEAYLTTAMLRAVVTDPKGTGWRLRELGRPLAGKTGTTNDQGDAWFMGFSPDLMTGVWVGHDESQFLGWGETGSRAAAPIWVDFMREALAKRPVSDFAVPDAIVFARIDRQTGLLASPTSTDTVFQAFLSGTEPTESETTARDTSEGRRLLRLDAF
jgi:penicillin-binding protein 1A